ncbi:ATP/GTP-binding protein [Streptomyces sp. 891-h]|uniref:ATP/GTP-binding protein n=1 Tax=Streptomyces sp. 891-h TaxID=2720714 RepID=UPI001FA9ED9B|nr:ATP/GTP-binding protein [Streptomyces sp. 891-h]UNZ21398.1 ATP/GTP-binding protein [Streptomyces sp. 891-h]
MIELLGDLVRGIVASVACGAAHPVLLTGSVLVVFVVAEAVTVRLARAASRRRVRLRMVPSKTFDPDTEHLWRSTVQLASAASSGPWWAPRRSRTLRACLRADADGGAALDYFVEAPAAARHLLSSTPLEGVRIEPVGPRPQRKELPHVVRAEFTLRGPQVARLREVPLVPDPLQPLVDAVATLRTELGESAEVCVDIQQVPPWQLRLRRWQRLADARAYAQRQAERDARKSALASLSEDSFRIEIADMVSGRQGQPLRRLALPPKSQSIERERTLGKLAESAGLLRVQILARCTATRPERAAQRIRHIASALQIFAGDVRLSQRGRQLGPWRLDANRKVLRRAFDRRWRTGQVSGAQASWVHASEIAGLLKPPTRHCRMPLRQQDLPVYTPGTPGLMPHGWHRGADGKERLIATRLEETLVSVRSGKTAYGKTTQAITQMIALAHDGGGNGGLFIDPHGDAMRDAAAFLAHPHIAERLLYLDLTGSGSTPRIGAWNALGVEHGQRPEQVVHAVVDAFADMLGWTDTTHPRALTVLTKAAEALVQLNVALIGRNRPDAQATLFQIEPLLTDAVFRQAVLDTAALPEESARWWRSTFPTIPPDAYPTVLNPIERLGRRSTIRAFLGQPTSSYHLRDAMDTGKLVWICPSATGPTDRLLLSLLFNDLYRTGLSRRDIPPQQRRAFHVFVDELLSIDGAVELLAPVSEQLRKFGVRLHGMTQLLQRISSTTRYSLLQNASVISSTAASHDAALLVAREWNGTVDPAELTTLDRYEHLISLTYQGKTVGPLRIRGPQPGEVFASLARPDDVGRLRQQADTNLAARPVVSVLDMVGRHTTTIAGALRQTPSTQCRKDEGGAVEPELT